MMATVLISGAGSEGTGFLIGRPISSEPKKLRFTLVTADHVLRAIKGETAIVHHRRLNEGKWESVPTRIRIRKGDNPMWAKHPEVDVAAMYVPVPKIARPVVIPMSLLGSDALIKEYEINPGEVLNCVGYPFGSQTFTFTKEGAFPVLRSGKIASYPLVPTKHTKTFLLDLRVFPGNSGGPVYVSFTGERLMQKDNAITLGTSFQFIMGLVKADIRLTQTIKELYGIRQQEYPLGLAEIVHASFITETIELLPDP
jgi:S1-C subfamily serine protease